MSMELSSYLVIWVVTYLGDLQPTSIGVIIYLLSSMDILVVLFEIELNETCKATKVGQTTTMPKGSMVGNTYLHFPFDCGDFSAFM